MPRDWQNAPQAARGRRWDSPSTEPFTITKLAGAERQLCAAIRLFFAEEDPVAIHTLVGAAGKVLRDLCRQAGKRSARSEMLDLVKPEMLSEVRRTLDAPRNYLKHADRDHEATLTIRPAVNQWVLYEAVLTHIALTSQLLPETYTFATWVQIRHPDTLLPGPLREFVTSPLARDVDTDDLSIQLDAIEWLRATVGERFTLPIGGS